MSNGIQPSGSSQATLNRTTFRTSREMDFFSVKELTTQTCHEIESWPHVILKELIDNSLDACEEADVAPVIHVKADATSITVSDNGPGMREETIAGIRDFTVRVSSREAYVAPDRGAQGNAMKTLLGMPYVVDPEHGRFSITTRGVQHDITCRVDQLTQTVMVEDKPHDTGQTSGTTIRLEWGERYDDYCGSVWPFGDECCPEDGDERGSVADDLLQLIRGYTFFNPHLTLTLDWFDNRRTTFKATNSDWPKWKPNKPTSAHWYEQEHFERLVAASITHGREHGTDRTVAEFLREFDGLAGSGKRKQVSDSIGLKRVNLSDFATADGGLDHDLAARLLASMQEHTKPVKPTRLGILGKEHITRRLMEIGCDSDQIEYTKVARVDDGLPFVLEVGFGAIWDATQDGRIFTGVNWSPAIQNPFQKIEGCWGGLPYLLRGQYVGSNEPVAFVFHLADPRVDWLDRGKSSIAIRK